MQAKSRLYARRLRGDIGPLGIDPRTRLPGAILAPAVSLTGADQYYDEASDVQNFEIGSRMQLIRGRVFYYARVGAVAIANTSRGVKNLIYQHVEGLPSPAAVAPVAPIVAAGALQVAVTVAVTDGILADGAIAANELVGGHIVIFPFGVQPRGINREIVANTATSAATTLVMTVTLDRPLPVALAANSTAALMASEYATVGQDDEWKTVLGLAMVEATALQYIWLQTWGPTWQGAQLNVGDLDGTHPNNHQVVFRADGSMGLHGLTGAGAIDVTTAYAQHAGYTMATLNPYPPRTAPAPQRGAPFIFLQITP